MLFVVCERRYHNCDCQIILVTTSVDMIPKLDRERGYDFFVCVCDGCLDSGYVGRLGTVVEIDEFRDVARGALPTHDSRPASASYMRLFFTVSACYGNEGPRHVTAVSIDRHTAEEAAEDLADDPNHRGGGLVYAFAVDLESGHVETFDEVVHAQRMRVGCAILGRVLPPDIVSSIKNIVQMSSAWDPMISSHGFTQSPVYERGQYATEDDHKFPISRREPAARLETASVAAVERRCVLVRTVCRKTWAIPLTSANDSVWSFPGPSKCDPRVDMVCPPPVPNVTNVVYGPGCPG